MHLEGALERTQFIYLIEKLYREMEDLQESLQIHSMKKFIRNNHRGKRKYKDSRTKKEAAIMF